jgi:hypothetical protein
MFVVRMESYCEKANQCDRIIASMFSEYEKDVKDTLEGSMWGIEDFEGNNANELIGYQFHKSFRQTDVIPAKHIDGILWSCMQDAPLFWYAMERACRILVSEDAAELYKDEVW